MAQTKRKRQTKHRGNAAGMVETRGRTGRKPTEDERKATAKGAAKATRQQRLDRPPTWKASINRAAIATVVFVLAVALVFKEPLGATIGLAGFVFAMYVPLGYYTDRFVYRRRMARKTG